MPKEHPIEEYPDAFFKVFDGDGLTLTCGDAREASALRQQLYAFRRVLRASPQHAQLSRMADGKRIVLVGSKLFIRPKRPNGTEYIIEALK